MSSESSRRRREIREDEEESGATKGIIGRHSQGLGKDKEKAGHEAIPRYGRISRMLTRTTAGR
jgi:hypothetical protein